MQVAHAQPNEAARFAPLDAETRTAVDTATAAYHLNRQPQTLRGLMSQEVV